MDIRFNLTLTYRKCKKEIKSNEKIKTNFVLQKEGLKMSFIDYLNILLASVF